MRLLLFSDLHCDRAGAQKLVELSQDVDVVIGAGDFAKSRHGLQELIDALSPITCPSILVPGNNESYDELELACKVWPAAQVLHGSGTEVQGIKFWGVGGAIPPAGFSSSWDFSEDEGRQLLADCPKGAILIAHSPPYGIVDQLASGESRGSVAILETIKKHQPVLVACGHIHPSWGQTEMVGNTRAINAGPTGIIWETSP
jgi:Icc-related predicted phosphoesterase